MYTLTGKNDLIDSTRVYFTDLNNIANSNVWATVIDPKELVPQYVREVVLDEKSQVKGLCNGWYETNNAMLGERVEIWSSTFWVELMVKENGFLIKHVNENLITDELKRMAVENTEYSLNFIKNPSQDLKNFALECTN